MLMLAAASTALAAPQQVQLVLSGAGDPYRGLASSLEARLRRDGDARRLGLLPMQAREFDGARADLTVSVGMKACETVVAAGTARPALCVLVPKAGFRRLAQDASTDRLSAIYLDQPVARQLALARALLPEARRAGVLAGPEVRREGAGIHLSARAVGLEVDLEATDGTTHDAARGIGRLLRDTDLILAVYEPDVLTPSTAKWLLHLAHQQRRPVVGFSRAYVEAGAVAAVFSTPEQIGRQTAEAILSWVRGGGRGLAPAAYPLEFDIEVNRTVATALGLEPPSNGKLKKQVARISGGVP
jgi:ABC-type uncharacterized transport system substrate-binding protein